ncbi:hypothetical protein [Lentilactobacillus hilgardii]|uniref:hypothetical protein n=1 Tax=Lentilactobacillus hilgardii TaxID=1588 RepID=UPI00019C5E2A|nr:hypothetical protein [Lentilactobacillus hilgardii]EEI19152.1 hypothetical protein HMPREF0497_1962 [Lentilactobacillus buchneri ATCC 11577]MCP9331976.1 hypothetical protein [Lentilactobacillus hilgardii]MCP9348550.1 hypothetical protein [Lentilactobacillus hilgardii]MCP9351397.1 hypothetical protein [Lentilactobacillus hilgardii]MCT3395729.1 hypothetical protein [Lentilactobacillus hilgardii]
MEDNIKLGNPVFDNMLFVLDRPVTEKNHKDYRFENEELLQISEGVWAMPAYMKNDDDFSLFFIITEIDNGQTVLAFSTGEKKGSDFSLSNPILTGKGLNLLTAHDKDRAASILHFINQISKAAEGNWRMVEN